MLVILSRAYAVLCKWKISRGRWLLQVYHWGTNIVLLQLLNKILIIVWCLASVSWDMLIGIIIFICSMEGGKMLIHPVKTQTTISISTQTLLMRLWTGKTYNYYYFFLFCVLLTVLDSYISLLFTNQVCTVLYQTTDVGWCHHEGDQRCRLWLASWFSW